MLDSNRFRRYGLEDRMTQLPPSRRQVWMRLHPKGRERLKGALLLRDMSHRQLAEAIGWRSHGMVSQLLTGRRKTVSADSAVMIAKVLGIPVHDLFLTESLSDTRQGSRAGGAVAR